MGIATWLYECLCPASSGSGATSPSGLCSHAYCYWATEEDSDHAGDGASVGGLAYGALPDVSETIAGRPHTT